MPKRGKEPRQSSRHSSSRFSPPAPPRQSRNDYQVAGPSHSTSDSRSDSGRRSPHSNESIKISNGNTRHGNSNRVLKNVVDSPIIVTDDDEDGYKNLDTSVNVFREHGNKLKPGTSESTGLVKHFVPSADRYHIPQSAPEKPMFRGPETDVLLDLEKDKLKNIRVQMIRADVQQNESFRKAYVIEEPVASKSKGEKNHQNFETHFNSTQMHYDNSDKTNYGSSRSLSPSRVMARDQSLSPRMNTGRPPSPPLPYTERDHFNSDNMLRRERSKRSPERNIHERPPRPDNFMEQHKMENFPSGLPPEPRSPEMQRFRPSDHSRHRMKEVPNHFEDRSRRSRSPEYFDNHYGYRSPSPTIRPYSPNHEQMPVSPPPRNLSSPPLRDRPSHSSDRSRRRRSPPRRDRSRDRRRRISPKRRTPPSGRSPVKRRNENGKSRTISKNQEPRKRESRGRRNRRSQSKPKSSSQEQQLTSFQQPQQQPMYPPPPPPGVLRLPPPRPFPPGMMIPMRPPFPPPMGAWRPARPPMQAPSGWPYPRPRPFYYPY